MATKTDLRKLKKSAQAGASDVAKQVAQQLFELEANHKTLKAALSHLHINSVKEVQVTEKTTALVVFYSLRFIRKFRKIQKTVTAELEKKFAGKQVIFVAQRKIAPVPKSNMARRQRSRTLTAVHDAIIEDIVFPADIVARRVHYKTDGTKTMQIFFDEKFRELVEPKLAAFAHIALQLTGRKVVFGFMSNPALQQVSAQ